MRFYLMAAAMGALAACQPAVPDSAAGVGDPGRGVGFDSYAQSVPAAPSVSSQTLDGAAAPAPAPAATGGFDPDLVAASLAEDERAAAANSGREVVNASPSNPAPAPVSNPGISDENDFDAVASRQTIASDKARIAQNAAQYEVVQPTALPARDGSGGPNVVEYALQTKHARGTKVYTRLGFGGQSKMARNCAKYPNDDDAQIDFLASGGPSRDRMGLDPDGDGFACNWDPSPFRRAAQN
ncbi:hypothetical protein [Pseudosulfitobacter pseudonitzschiae]|uniref:Excalibur calcium-binding domain-containing protein n=1 Tax=Pseudosulfitobacter pseudonitzschiae TaxID=1402135 RepID=A0A073J2Z0_9RHOB|nr:hypothetical protein [Pseudosulfitobacter pseudonitzschiae]KEJ96359.1 hypothetical protein SUH3_13440 [Pseudosulfitobacter pseudonitzschiae]MBM1813844.1 hypothetical protein [Pseudosulfitobacter pseudonitzschiae]MBM1830837.1 hypothetical protein [Pseudosulfitobacter pseudonitzschiae]MBM1835704.1 hypothetical protein [Pseudosulfitobacter pseudonitzschiae]MBM1840550.1 hypothetical protein [Pseudosulfitobacter pseudonitzschiae]